VLAFSVWFDAARARSRDGNADKRALSDRYVEGDKKGMVMVSFDAKNKLR
jgi:hypothetical protein